MGAYIYKLTGTPRQTFTIYDKDGREHSCGRITYSYKPGWDASAETSANSRIVAGIDRRWGEQLTDDDVRPDFVVVKYNTSKKPKALDQVLEWGKGNSLVYDDPNWNGLEAGFLVPRKEGGFRIQSYNEAKLWAHFNNVKF